MDTNRPIYVPDDASLYAQIWVRHRKNPRFRYPALNSKPKTHSTEIYIDACFLPQPKNSKTPETQRNHLLG
ncbi:hypothetical protein ACTXT7_009336 [Hymenolepis weldensis]